MLSNVYVIHFNINYDCYLFLSRSYKGLYALFQANLMTMPNSKQYPPNLCLIKHELDININWKNYYF